MASSDSTIRPSADPAERTVTSLESHADPVESSLESHAEPVESSLESHAAKPNPPLISPPSGDVCPICLIPFADSQFEPSWNLVNADRVGHPAQPRTSDRSASAAQIESKSVEAANSPLPASDSSPSSAASPVVTLSPIVALSPCMHRFCLPCIRVWSCASRADRASSTSRASCASPLPPCPLCKRAFRGWFLPAAAPGRDSRHCDYNGRENSKPKQDIAVAPAQQWGVFQPLPPLTEQEPASTVNASIRDDAFTSTLATVTWSEGLDERLRQEAASRGVPEWVLLPDWSTVGGRVHGQPQGQQNGQQQDQQGGQRQGRWNLARRRLQRLRARRRRELQQQQQQPTRSQGVQQLSPYFLRMQQCLQSSHH